MTEEQIASLVFGKGGVQDIRESWGAHSLHDEDGLAPELRTWLGDGVTPYQFFLETELAKLRQSLNAGR